MIGVDYLVPIDRTRDIKTTNLDFNALVSNVEKLNLLIYLGMVATYASGSIIQLEGNLEAGTLREVHFDNTAFGLGPGVLVQFKWVASGPVAVHLNASGHFVLYNKRFPAGGERYNFMWRGGPSIEYGLGNSGAIGLGYQWSHVSNGQGESPENPSYDARGFVLRFKGTF